MSAPVEHRPGRGSRLRRLRSVRLELHGGRRRLLWFAACLGAGVLAVSGVASLVAAIEGGVRAQARRILGADLVIEARRVLPDELDRFIAGRLRVAAQTAQIELPTMVSGGARGASRLVELRAVEGAYPLYGRLVTDPPGIVDPARAMTASVDAATALVAPDLGRALGLDVGDEIRIGAAAFRISGWVVDEPDRLEVSFTLGPRVLLTGEGLDRTRLLEGVGTRMKHRALFRFESDATKETLGQLAKDLRETLPEGAWLDVTTHHDAEPGLRRTLAVVESTLGLGALLSLVLGGVGVAEVVRSWLAERTRSIAILRCLGVRASEVVLVAAGEIVLLAAAGCAAGAAAGSLVPWIASAVAPDLVPREVLVWSAWPAVRGFALGLGVALAFAVAPLLATARVPPVRVFRAEVEPLPAPALVRFGALAAAAVAVFLASASQADRWLHAAVFTAGLGAVAALLALVAAGLGAAARRLPALPLPTAIRGGLAALGRPGAGAATTIAGLGIGVGAVVTQLVVEQRVDAEILAALPETAPTVFLVDVQPHQWPDVESMLDGAGSRGVESVPVVTARLAEVGGRPVADLVAERKGGGRAEWVLTREQRLTWRDALPSSNALAAGTWFRDDGRDEASLEADYARDLGAGVGTPVRFDVQGVPVEFEVSSLRSVAWESFAINFFWIVEPGALAGAPHARIASASVPEAEEAALQDRLAAAFPNVTMLRLRPLLERIRSVLGRLAFGVRALGLFAAIAGVTIVAGAVAASTLRRRREVALLRAVGASRRAVRIRLATEYAVAGAVAGTVGGAAGLALAGVFLVEVLRLPAGLPVATALPLAAAVAAALAAAAGLAASRPALEASPAETLR